MRKLLQPYIGKRVFAEADHDVVNIYEDVEHQKHILTIFDANVATKFEDYADSEYFVTEWADETITINAGEQAVLYTAPEEGFVCDITEHDVVNVTLDVASNEYGTVQNTTINVEYRTDQPLIASVLVCITIDADGRVIVQRS